MGRRVASSVLALCLSLGNALAVDYVRLSPSEFSEDLRKASTLLDEQQYEPAIELLKGLVADEPRDADALILMGFALRKSGDLPRAEGFYKRALAVEPTHLGALQYLGELYLERGELDRARSQLSLLDAACPSGCAGRDALAAAILSVQPR